MTMEEALKYLQTTEWKVQDDIHKYPWEPIELLYLIEQEDPDELERPVALVFHGRPGIYVDDAGYVGKRLYDLVQEEDIEDYEDELEESEPEAEPSLPPGFDKDKFITDTIKSLSPEKIREIIDILTNKVNKEKEEE